MTHALGKHCILVNKPRGQKIRKNACFERTKASNACLNRQPGYSEQVVTTLQPKAAAAAAAAAAAQACQCSPSELAPPRSTGKCSHAQQRPRRITLQHARTYLLGLDKY